MKHTYNYLLPHFWPVASLHCTVLWKLEKTEITIIIVAMLKVMFIEFYSSLGAIDFNLWGKYYTTLQNWAYLPFRILDHCLFHYLLARARCIIIYACGTSRYQATRSVIFCFDYRLLLLKISAKTQSEQEWDFSLVFFGTSVVCLLTCQKARNCGSSITE